MSLCEYGSLSIFLLSFVRKVDNLKLFKFIFITKKTKRLCLKAPLSLGTIQRWMYFVAQRLWLNEGIPCFLSRTIANAGIKSASMVREDQSLLSPSAVEWRDRTLDSLSWFTSDCRVENLTYCAAPTIAKEKNKGELGVNYLDHISCL